MSRAIVLTGEFRPYQSIDVMAKVAGYVKSINVDVGSRVAAGQLLATLEIPEMADSPRSALAFELRDQIERAIRDLPETYRSVVLTRDVEELSTPRNR